LQILPWEAFAVLWFAAHAAALVVLRVPWMLAAPFVLDDALYGNTYTFLALAVVLILRHGLTALWASVLLTKVTPAVGMAWHIARREWRQLGVAMGASALIVAVGAALDANLWAQWFEALIAAPENYAGPGRSLAELLPRMAAGALLAGYAGRRDRKWLVPVAMLVAVPGFFEYSFAFLVAAVVLYRDGRSRQPELEPVPMAVGESTPVLIGAPLAVPASVSDEGSRANSRTSIR
jgi:hypothetical protein